MKNKNLLDRILTIILSILNSINFISLLTLFSEEIQMNWEHGTNLELAVLYPWLIQFLGLPIIVFTIFYLIFRIKKSDKKLFITNLLLLIILLIQYILINLLIFF